MRLYYSCSYFATYNIKMVIRNVAQYKLRRLQLMLLVCFWYMRPPQFLQQRQHAKNRPIKGMRTMYRIPMATHTRNPTSQCKIFTQDRVQGVWEKNRLYGLLIKNVKTLDSDTLNHTLVLHGEKLYLLKTLTHGTQAYSVYD